MSTPMNIRFLSQNRPGNRMGMGHYERLLLTALSKADTAERCVFDFVFSGSRNGNIDDWESPISQLRGGRMLGFSTLRLSQRPWWVARRAIEFADRGKPDLYHSLALSFPAPSRRPAVYTIHDLPPARFDDEGKVPRWAKQAVAEAAAIHVPSEFAKLELMELLGLPESKIHVIPYGCETDVFNSDVQPASKEALAELGIQSPYLVYVGGFTRRKNIRALLAAWRTVQETWGDVQLVLAGPEQPLQRLLNEEKVSGVQVAGYLGRDVLPSVLKASEALVFPSIYEGFGLPPLEALAMGVPVVAVRAGAIPGVVGDAALLAESGESGDIAVAIDRLLSDSQLRDTLIQAGPRRASTFSWQRHGRDMLDLYQRISVA